MIDSALPPEMDLDATYYISGPMTGYENFNYKFFGEVKDFLELCGLKIESPHLNEWPPNHRMLSQQELWEHMMELCYAQMDKCDGIILLRGWSESRGAWLELERMRRDAKPVYYFDDDSSRVICMNKRRAVA